MPRPFSLAVRKTDRSLTLTIHGELDALTAPRLCDVVDEAIASGVVDVVVDCRRMEFMDSAGVGALLDLNKQLANRGGALILFGVMGSVLQTLATTGLDRVFHVIEAPTD